MKKNVGPTDRVIRIAMAAIVAVLFVSNTVSGTLALVLGAFAIILLITSFVNFCPLYWSFGINTRKPK